MQHRLKEKHKIHKKDIEVDMNDLRKELQQSIEYEKHRDNVDQAKKRAVKQLMDYDNFHQMVLGADLKPLQTQEVKDLIEIGATNSGEIILNHTTGNKKKEVVKDIFNQEIFKNFKPERKNLDKEKKENETELTEDEIKQQMGEIPNPKNYREYNKIVNKIYNRDKPVNNSDFALIVWHTLQPKTYHRRIYSVNFEIGYLINIVDILLEWINDEEIWKERKNYFVWFLDFLTDLTNMSSFEFGLKSLFGKTESILLRKLLDLIAEKNENVVDFVEDLQFKFK